MYYSRFSVSEGLDTETNELQMNLERFDKDIFKKCTYCHQVFAIKKNVKKDEKTCNACVKLLEKEVKISPKMYILGQIMQITEYLQIFSVIMLKTFFIETQ